MTSTYVDPRVVAETLHMDTLQLAEVLTKWASESLPRVEVGRVGPTPLETFDERVGDARRYLAEAHAAMDAWNTDNPDDPEAA